MGTIDFHCLLCGCREEHPLTYASRGFWNYYLCRNCGVVSLSPTPQGRELEVYYNEAYSVAREAYARGTKRNAPPILRKLAENLPGKGKLLELGSSYGFFLDAARRDGWDVTGIELDSNAAAYGRERLGLRVFPGTLESELARLQPPYDAIAAFHVLEHVSDPMRFLLACRKLLRNGGMLMLKTPNVASWIAKRTKADWGWLSPPAHIHLLSPGSLELALRKSGFRVQEIGSRRGDACNNLFELVYSLGRHMLLRGPGQARVGNGRKGWSDRWQVKAVRTASEAIYYPLRLVLDPWLEKKGLQPELLAIARL